MDMKNISDNLEDLLEMMDKLDKKLDEIIERNTVDDSLRHPDCSGVVVQEEKQAL